MSTPLKNSHIAVNKSSLEGYGVFALKNFRIGEIIEECHSLISTADNSGFANYVFDFDGKNHLPLGFGCIYNHSDEPHAKYYYDVNRQIVVFEAIRPIQEGEEILISYGKDWFKERKMRMLKAVGYDQVVLARLSAGLFRVACVIALILFTIYLINK